MRQNLNVLGSHLPSLFPPGKPADVLVQLWERAEQKIPMVQPPTNKSVQPESRKKTVNVVRYSYD